MRELCGQDRRFCTMASCPRQPKTKTPWHEARGVLVHPAPLNSRVALGMRYSSLGDTLHEEGLASFHNTFVTCTPVSRWVEAKVHDGYPGLVKLRSDPIRELGRKAGHFLLRIDRRVPPGLRTLLGVLLILGGLFGILPILGFWMVPLGILVVGLDVSALRRALQKWQRHQKGE